MSEWQRRDGRTNLRLNVGIKNNEPGGGNIDPNRRSTTTADAGEVETDCCGERITVLWHYSLKCGTTGKSLTMFQELE